MWSSDKDVQRREELLSAIGDWLRNKISPRMNALTLDEGLAYANGLKASRTQDEELSSDSEMRRYSYSICEIG